MENYYVERLMIDDRIDKETLFHLFCFDSFRNVIKIKILLQLIADHLVTQGDDKEKFMTDLFLKLQRGTNGIMKDMSEEKMQSLREESARLLLKAFDGDDEVIEDMTKDHIKEMTKDIGDISNIMNHNKIDFSDHF